ncbi:MAG: RsmE family RNA methyltransferase [Erysipelotrichaceae bacterium]
MQQYFIETELTLNDEIELRDDILYHLKKVLRGTNETFRLCDSKGKIYLASLKGDKALIKKYLDEHNELDIDITAVISLIKSDKFELILQKLTELGVKRIVPYNAQRSIVKEKKGEKKLERYKKILTEASEQCHRNFVPEIVNAIDFKDIDKYMSDLNLIAYEKESPGAKSDLKNKKSITFVIGPEGGFSEKEYEAFLSKGFRSISLGKRILRAETAAIYLGSIISEVYE